MDCQARGARRLFWGFGWDDLRPRRYERTNGHKDPSSGSQWSSEMFHNEKDILYISKVNVDVRQCAHCREASVLRSTWWAFDMISMLLTMLTNESQGKFARSRYTNFSKRPRALLRQQW